MKLVRLLLVAIMTVIFFSLLLTGTTSSAYAATTGNGGFDGFQEVCSGSDASTSAVCTERSKITPGSNPITAKGSVFERITNIIAAIAGIITVVMIIFAGLQMIMSTGDAQKFNTARQTLIFATIGVVVVILARVAVSFIVNHI